MKKHVPTSKTYPLVPTKPVKKTLNTLIQVLVSVAFTLLFFSTFIISIFGFSKTMGLVLFWLGAATLVIFWYESIYYKKYHYDLTPDYLLIKKGVFTYGETTIPYGRVQDVYLDRDILDKFFGLYDLHVSTASGQSSVTAHIDGLSKEGAEAIKKELLKKASSSSRELRK